MRKLLFHTFVCIAFLGFTGCSSDDDNGSGGVSADSSFTIDGTEYDLKSGMLEYWGSWDDPDVHNFDLVLTTTEVNIVDGDYFPEDNVYSVIDFELWTDSANDLNVGTYEYSSDESAGTFSSGSVNVGINEEEETVESSHYITDGTVEVLENGSGTYSIVFNCVTFDGTEVSGSYDGFLFTEDVAGKHAKPSSKNILSLKKK